MFAGPNGSGKSSLEALLPPKLQGVYLNPDELEQHLRSTGQLDLGSMDLEGSGQTTLNELALLKRPGRAHLAGIFSIDPTKPDLLFVEPKRVDSYVASALVECIRKALMDRRMSFTFETVMSHPSKVEVFKTAKSADYRNYLYYVATEDVEINIARVANRVSLGGHTVPEGKIRERYTRSLDLLWDAILATDRAYIFDNSGDGSPQSWIAEITDDREIELRTPSVPHWFKVAILDKLPGHP